MDLTAANQSLTIYLPVVRCGEVRLVSEALSILEEVYSAFVLWDKLVAAAEQNAREEEGIHYRNVPRRELGGGPLGISEEEALCLARIEVIPPAYAEIVGLANPLQALQAYLSTERIAWNRDKQEPEEDRRLALEQQRINSVGAQVGLLRGLNYPEIQIREALAKYVFAPWIASTDLAVWRFIQQRSRAAGRLFSRNLGALLRAYRSKNRLGFFAKFVIYRFGAAGSETSRSVSPVSF